jgi:ABC-type multidrug transport system ATPase subunit
MSELIDPALTVSPYISKIKVRDYAPLRAASVDFKRGLNIIIGSNGAGKTRFLSLLNELADLRENTKHYQGSGCELTFGGGFSEQTRFTVTFEEDNATLLLGEPLEWDITDWELPGVKITEKYSDQLAERRSVEYFLGAYPSLFIPHGTPTSGLPILDESAELVLEKRNVAIQLKDGPRRIEELNSRFSQVVVRSIVGMVRNGFTVLNGVPVPPPTAETLRQWLTKLIAESVVLLNNLLPLYSPVQAVRCSEYFQVYHQEVQDQYTIKGLVLEYQINNEWLSFRMLSDGTKRLVYIIAEIFAPEVLGIDKLKGEAKLYARRHQTVLLEEPELGIHPDQLQKLLSLIRQVSKEHQVIMTTHSPQVLNMLTTKELDRITICELDPKKGTQFRKLSPAKRAKAKAYMQNDSYLSDFWLYSNLEAE